MIKLNIQRFASTNQTPHYDLSQYVANDKPTYLVDYNQDMSKIDTAIYDADSRSLVNESSIGTMSNLDTTDKSSLVGAINEVKGEADTNANNISTNTSNISTLGTNQGNMANLTTTDKTTLVGAINEVDAVNQTQNNKIGDITELETTDKSNLVNAINEVLKQFNLTSHKNYTASSPNTDLVLTNCNVSTFNMTSSTNSDGSVFKFYGYFTAYATGSGAKITFKNTGINPSEAFNIAPVGTGTDSNSSYSSTASASYPLGINILSNGDIEINLGISSGTYRRFNIYPCMYIAKNFGDAPVPE